MGLEQEESERLVDQLSSGKEIPYNLLFKELAELYQKKTKAKNKELADFLGVRPQTSSQWKTGTDGRRPTWRALMQLCDVVNRQIVITPDEAFIIRRRKQKAKAE